MLTIMNRLEGGEDTPFLDADNPIRITEYTFSSSRMGQSRLTATLRYPVCLDNEWDGKQYVSFGGEDYFLSSIPSSSKDNEDLRYVHNLEFLAERDIKLSNIYFYDAVSEESTGDDRYRSNSTKVMFFGTIHEFVARLNESLSYSGVGYTAVVDDGIESEAKLMSFEDQFFSDVLREIFNIYEFPYYFVGKVIHIGYTSNALAHTFKYGMDDGLLSIKKNNANNRVITRCTGIGSEDNIPYYYPNQTESGNPRIETPVTNTGISASDVTIEDLKLFTETVGLGKDIEYSGPVEGSVVVELSGRPEEDYEEYVLYSRGLGAKEVQFQIRTNFQDVVRLKITIQKIEMFAQHPDGESAASEVLISGIKFSSPISNFTDIKGTQKYFDMTPIKTSDSPDDGYLRPGDGFYIDMLVPTPENKYVGFFTIYYNIVRKKYFYGESTVQVYGRISMDIEIINRTWKYEDKKYLLSELGLSIEGIAVPAVGDRITRMADRIADSKNLLPPIYRETNGAERFYNAVNDTYTNPDTGLKYEFENEYVQSAPKEHIQAFDDIKPTIKGMKNASGQRMDTILDVAFDEDDNDDVDEEGNYLHPHFFVKLPKYDGEHGFNLFDHSIDEDEMSLSMTSGQCGACEFTIAVGEETQKNIVQVDEEGNLMRDEDGNVIVSGAPQDRQNDTENNEVWLALKKEENTYGQIMPNVLQALRPAAGDTFVILHIELPEAYVTAAEQRLEDAIIRYMAENNSEKFNFSITFSRIFLAENPDIASQLNENARIQIEYNGRVSQFYISQYTCKCTDDSALPEITVEISDTITVNRTVMQNTADAIINEVNALIGNSDILMQGMQYFIRKDVADEVAARTKFLMGVEFGRFNSGPLGSGAAVTIAADGSSELEVDYLSVRRRAEFTQITVEELKGIGGQLIISPAAMKCIRVEETVDSYRCYFDPGDSTAGGIFNMFVVNDQVRSQQFNLAGGRFYWRLVTAVGEDYIDLSKSDCAENSDAPMAGDYMIQLGNRSDTARQSAQVLSCYSNDSPSFVMYAGITSYDLTDRNIVGIVTSPDTGEPQMYCYGSMFFGDRDLDAEDATYITFQQKAGDNRKRLYISADIMIGSGSSGLTNLQEWAAAQASITSAEQNASSALQMAQDAKDYIDTTLPSEIQEINDRLDGVVENWFYPYTPSLDNEPASTWVSDGDEENHIGDTFTNTQQYVDDETTPDAGKSWRWVKEGDAYMWTPIADSDAVKALLKAAEAQDTADQKRRVFISTPYTPYDVGDIWTQGPAGDIMRCIKARMTGSYTASDWDRASNYTDDTIANEALQKTTDLEYLKEMFNTPTVDSEGAILAKLLSVKDSAGNVVAGLNSSELGEDSEHGKLLFFSGSTDIQDISSAVTRIYEDGTLFTNAIYADGGYFGILEIEKLNANESQLTGLKETPIPGNTSYLTHYGIYIRPNQLIVSASDDLGEQEQFIVTPLNSYSTTGVTGLLQLRNYGTIKTGSQRSLLLIDQIENMRAIHINGGYVAGLRPMCRMVTGNTTLTKEDFIVICNNNSFTITLPRDPENGQTYFIFNPSLNNTSYKYGYSPDKEIYSMPSGKNETNRRSTFVKAGLYIYTFVKSDDKWWLDYMQNQY